MFCKSRKYRNDCCGNISCYTARFTKHKSLVTQETYSLNTVVRRCDNVKAINEPITHCSVSLSPLWADGGWYYKTIKCHLISHIMRIWLTVAMAMDGIGAENSVHAWHCYFSRDSQVFGKFLFWVAVSYACNVAFGLKLDILRARQLINGSPC